MSDDSYKRSILQFLETSIKVYHETKPTKKFIKDVSVLRNIEISNRTKNSLVKITGQNDDKANNNIVDKDESKNSEWHEVKSRRKSKVNVPLIHNIVKTHIEKNGRVKITGTEFDNGKNDDFLEETASTNSNSGSSSLFSSRWNSGSLQESTASRFNDYSSASSRFNNSYSASRFNNYSSPASRYDNSCSSSRYNSYSSLASRLSNSSTSTNVQDQRSNQMSSMSGHNDNESNSKEEPVIQYFTGEDCIDDGDLNYYDDSYYTSVKSSKSSPSPELERNDNGKPLHRLVRRSLSTCEKFNKGIKDTGLPADAFENDVSYSYSHEQKYSSQYTQERLNGSTNDYSTSNQNHSYDGSEIDFVCESNVNHSEENTKYVAEESYSQNCPNETNYKDEVDDENYISCEESRFHINPRLKERLKIIIQKHPDGIWCADLPNIYCNETGLTLNYLELGFVSVFAFVSELPDVFHCVFSKLRSDHRLYNAQQPLPDIKTQERRCQFTSAEKYRVYIGDEPEPLPSRLDPSLTDNLFPDDVMLLNERVGQILVSELCADKEYEEVVLIEVFNPSFFWIQLRKKISKFKKFMNNLHMFYEEEYNKYKIPAITLDKGLNVACKYAEKWHRGIIIAVLPDGMSIVHFYDYGTVKSYKPQHLFYLHRRFSDLPAQAIPCGLYNVRPKDSDKWHKSITWKFIKKTSCPLIANVIVRNVEENSVLITLTDTQKDDDFHINDWMINEKLGVIGNMIRNSTSYESQLYALLLRDIYPKKMELILLMSKNIDLKNLVDYEEGNLPKNLEAEKSSSNTQGPPPGFQSRQSNSEEILKPNVDNNSKDTNDVLKLQDELLKMHNKMQNADLEAYKAFLQQFLNKLKISNSDENNLQAPSTIKSNVLEQNAFCPNPQNIDVEEYFKTIPKLTENTESQPHNLVQREIPSYPSKVNHELFDHSNPQYQNLNPESVEFVKYLNKEMRIRENMKTSVNPEYPNLQPESAEFLKNSKKESRRENPKTSQIPNYQNLQPESAAFLRNSAEEIRRASLKTSENSEKSRTPGMKETNPFRMFSQVEFKPKPASTNPFINDFEPVTTPKKSARESLKSFLDSNSSEPKNEYLNTSNSSCRSNPDIFLFGDKKENTNFSFVNEQEKFVPTNIFSPVIDSTANHVNTGAKIFYESGPVMYDQTGKETKTENLDPNYQNSNWKPVPSAETIDPIGPSVKENGFSFKVSKPRSPSEKKSKVPHQNVSKPPVEIPVQNTPKVPVENLTKTTEMENKNLLKAMLEMESLNLSKSVEMENRNLLKAMPETQNQNLTKTSEMENKKLLQAMLEMNNQNLPKTTEVQNQNLLKSMLEMESQNLLKSMLETQNQNLPKSTIGMEENHRESPTNVGNRNKPKSLTDNPVYKDLLAAATFPLPSSSETSRTPTPTQEKPSKEWNHQTPSVPVGENSIKRLSDACVQTANPFIDEANAANPEKPTVTNKSAVDAEMSNLFRGEPKIDSNFKSMENATNSTISTSISDPENNSSCYMYPITTKPISLFVLDVNNEGWLISDEFVRAFTNLNGSSIMLRALNMVNVKIPFLEIDRHSHPTLLAVLDYSPLTAFRNSENKIIRPIHLTPLKFAPKILLSLHIISRTDWLSSVQDNKDSPNTVTNDIIKLISSYKTYMSTKDRP